MPRKRTEIVGGALLLPNPATAGAFKVNSIWVLGTRSIAGLSLFIAAAQTDIAPQSKNDSAPIFLSNTEPG
jgi:hypothetical protein